MIFKSLLEIYFSIEKWFYVIIFWSAVEQQAALLGF